LRFTFEKEKAHAQEEKEGEDARSSSSQGGVKG